MAVASSIVRGAAPGKVILFGEHAVVHGRPAIAAALSHGLGASLSKRATGWARLHIPRWGRNGLLIDAGKESTAPKDAITRSFFKALSLLGVSSAEPIDITIDGELPLGVGLGSSAAFTVVLLRVLANYAEQKLSDEDFITLAHELESIFHGNPSGLDHSVIIHNACARFMMGSPPTFEPIQLGVALPVVVGWLPRQGTTKDAVHHVAALNQRQPTLCAQVFACIENIVNEAVTHLQNGELAALGDLMNINHGLLSALGVVSDQNEQMVALARRAGALGAKVTGAGFGGAMIALAPGRTEQVHQSLKSHGFTALINQVSNH